MQRSGFNDPPPAQSPPLHHPVPQHVSTVPQLRSPPPPSSAQGQQHSGYGYGGGQQGQGAANSWQQPAFGGFMNDTTAQMGFQVGRSAVAAGQEYMEQNVHSYSPPGFVKDHADRCVTVRQVREGLYAQAPLQRQQLLCHPQDLPCLVPMAAPNVVEETVASCLYPKLATIPSTA